MKLHTLAARLLPAWILCVVGLRHFVADINGQPSSSVGVILLTTGAVAAILAFDGRRAGAEFAGALAVLGGVALWVSGVYAPRWVVPTAVAASIGLASLGVRAAARGARPAVVSAMSAAAVGPMMFAGLWAASSLAAAAYLAPFSSVLLALTFCGTGAQRIPGRAAEHRVSLILLPAVGVAVSMRFAVDARLPTLLCVAGAAVLLLAVVAPGPWDQLERSGRWLTDGGERIITALDRVLCVVENRVLRPVFTFVGRAFGLTMLVPTWLLLVLAPRAFHKAFAIDPAWAPRQPGSGWIRLTQLDPRSESTWAPDPASPGERRQLERQRRRPTLVRLCAVAVTALVVFGAVRLEPSDLYNPSTADADAGPALLETVQRQPWYPQYEAGIQELIAAQEVEQYAGLNSPDVTSEVVNISDGWRRSWTPPAGDCEPAEVWFFGGSAAFGQQQRDEHTIASEIARLAWTQDGRRLAMRNGGVHADVAWQEQLRADAALARHPEPPAAVIFYDGFNDFIAQHQAQMSGFARVGTLRSLNDANYLRLVTRLERVERGGQQLFEATPPTDPQEPVDLSKSVPPTAWQYEQAQSWARERLDGRGIPSLRFFQPSLATRQRSVAGEPTPSAHLVDAFAAFRTQLPQDVIDLSAILDAEEDPLFVDDVHTIEAASPIIAAAIYPKLLDVLPDGAGQCS